MNKRSLKNTLVLVIILLLPGFLYFLLQEKGENRYRPLAVFGPKKVAGTFHKKRGKLIPDTIYHTIRDFKLENQEGDTVSFPADSSHISIVNFFYTRCHDCLRTNRNVASLVNQFGNNKRLAFYSVTLDPEYDGIAVLKDYSRNFKIPSSKWSFLTGDKALIFRLVKEDFLLNAVPGKGGKEPIVHNTMLVLTDPHKRIRGYYDSASKEQMDKLADEIKVLIAEELRKIPMAR